MLPVGGGDLGGVAFDAVPVGVVLVAKGPVDADQVALADRLLDDLDVGGSEGLDGVPGGALLAFALGQPAFLGGQARCV